MNREPGISGLRANINVTPLIDVSVVEALDVARGAGAERIGLLPQASSTASEATTTRPSRSGPLE
jgi:biopolymer transport protein ExbD